MKRVEVHPDAQADFRESVRWYSERSAHIARRFARAVKSAISAIREHPDRYAKWGNVYRHYLVNGFPYFVAYRIMADVIIIGSIQRGGLPRSVAHHPHTRGPVAREQPGLVS